MNCWGHGWNKGPLHQQQPLQTWATSALIITHMSWWLLDFPASESGLTLLDHVGFRWHLGFVSQKSSASTSAVFLYLCSWACTHTNNHATGDFSMLLTPSLYKSGSITESSSADSCGPTHSSRSETLYFINITFFFFFKNKLIPELVLWY